MKNKKFWIPTTAIVALSTIGFSLSSCKKNTNTDDSLAFITVTKKPKKLTYEADEKLDLTDMVVTATYLDGTETTITDYTTKPALDTPLKVTDNKVVVSYKTKSYQFAITVTQEIKMTGIEPTYTGSTYSDLAVLKPDLLNVNAKFNDGSTSKLEIGTGYKVFEGVDDITSIIQSTEGYKMDTVKTYVFKFVSTIDQTITKDLSIQITQTPAEELFEAIQWGGGNKCTIKAKAKTLEMDVIEIPNVLKVKGVLMTVASIDSSGFKGAKASKITFKDPSKVEHISASSFENCVNLKSFVCPPNVSKINNDTFRGCTSLNSVTLPSSCTYVCSYAFYGCSSLSSITLNSGLKYIETYAFSKTSISSITFPTSMYMIYKYAFADTPLTSAHFDKTTNWKAVQGSAITIGTDAANATNLTNCQSGAADNWGYTGIIQASS